jgi:hypothetical protein
MRILMYLLLTSVSLNFCFAQSKPSSHLQPTERAEFKLITPDVIAIKNILPKEVKQSILEKYFASFVVIFFGIITAFINIYLARRLRKSTEINIEKQIKAGKDTTENQFKATLSAKNRQDWINDLRNSITDFLTANSNLLLEISKQTRDSEKISEFVDKMTSSKYKAELLLNDAKINQRNISQLLNEILLLTTEAFGESNNIVKVTAKKNELIISSQSLFNYHWEKIKKLGKTDFNNGEKS